MGLKPDLFRKIFDSLPFPKVPITLSDQSIVNGYFTSKITSTNTDEFGFSEEYDAVTYLPFDAGINAGDIITVLNQQYIAIKLEDYYVGTEKVAIKTYLKVYYG
ncbi:MAG TPA: hypothetical protein DEP48_02890 [Persephonella sp.]|uniref:Uncharacterized protein n=1 Tax=Persephonella marina (strain DSM 14350 / EX-H1) TaxID=123214 RepID=C0QS95_PERMH|nr:MULTISPECIES: hypothetical protein [Persephonella]ACO04009.1 hypothetical protein PERMA_1778 [Persephonella marina EX-H1]HCB69284.1 hypothetical protein [Persephonella sp.]